MLKCFLSMKYLVSSMEILGIQACSLAAIFCVSMMGFVLGYRGTDLLLRYALWASAKIFSYCCV